MTLHHVFLGLLDRWYLAHSLVNWRKFCVYLLFFIMNDSIIYFENVILVWHGLVVSIDNFFNINIHFSVAYWSLFKRFAIQFWSWRLICWAVLDCLSWFSLADCQNIGVKVARFAFRGCRLLIFNIIFNKNWLFQSWRYFNFGFLAWCLSSLLI